MRVCRGCDPITLSLVHFYSKNLIIPYLYDRQMTKRIVTYIAYIFDTLYDQ